MKRRSLHIALALVAGIAFASSGIAQSPDLGHYKLDEGAGQWAVNRAVPGATTCGYRFTNPVSWTAGPPAVGAVPALNFWPGTGGTDEVLWTGIFLNYTQSFTIECWFKVEITNPTAYVFGDYDSNAHRLYITGTTLSWRGAGATVTANWPQTATYPSAAGTWNHIACVQDIAGTTNTTGTATAPAGTPARLLYINGVFVDARPLPVLTNYPLGVTGLSVGDYFPYGGGEEVSVAEFRVWSTARAATDINTNYTVSLPTTGFVPQWETNSPGATLTVDSQLGQNCAPILGTKCPNEIGFVDINGTVGMPWEVGVSLLNPIPLSGGGILAGDQVLNLQLAGLVYLNNLAFTPFTGPITLPFASPNPLPAITAQLFMIDPTNAFGYSLSHCCKIEVIAPPTTIPGPTGDDQNMVLTPGGNPLCGPATIPFFGVTYTQMTINSNIRFAFGTPVNPQCCVYGGAVPDPELLQNPQGGAWNDMDVTAGGSISVSIIGGTTIRADWNAVPYWNNGTFASMPTNTVSLEIDASSGIFSIVNISGIGVHPDPAQPAMWMGICPGPTSTYPGWLAAAPHGNGVYTLGPHNGPAVATDMIYQYAAPGTIAPGVNRIDFIPNGIGSYDYICSP